MITLADMLRDMYGLTVRQTDVLCFILAERALGRSPSYRNLMDRFGWSAPTAARWHIEALKKKGALENQGRLARCFVPTFVFIPAEKLCG